MNSATRRFPAPGPNGELHALGPIDLDLEDGQFVAIIGPSGCGKSTLLRIAAGLEQPDEGWVLSAGKTVKGPVPKCGMVFQQFTLFPWLTVRGNVEFGIANQRNRVAVTKRLLEAVGLADFANHFPAHLSGGMQQRAALARALAPEPLVLLLDEPFGALDQQTRGLMQENLETLWRAKQRSILLVTHDVDEALFLADRVLVMSSRPGQILRSFDVSAARPRDHSLRTSANHIALKAAVSEILRDQARN
ncbi:MAG: sulfonate ABC transporter ATP-binding protein [Rhodospirillaceae bacterium]|nr:sulfonate ABC transporter ATP-binding protein [Rhodospirillaceae bacterium]